MEDKEKSKYYTPKIEEFHVGFEYESLDSGYLYDIEPIGEPDILTGRQAARVKGEPRLVKEWTKHIYDGTDFNYMEGAAVIKFDVPMDVRVKLLDKEDIESMSFINRPKNCWAGWNDYQLNEISGEYGYYLYATLHVPRMDDKYKIYVHRYLSDEPNIESWVKERESKLIYEGRIKNKSELKKILQMLGIANSDKNS